MVFGSILDSIEELRDEESWLENDIRGRCFICHIESSVFDKKANGSRGVRRKRRKRSVLI